VRFVAGLENLFTCKSARLPVIVQALCGIEESFLAIHTGNKPRKLAPQPPPYQLST